MLVLLMKIQYCSENKYKDNYLHTFSRRMEYHLETICFEIYTFLTLIINSSDIYRLVNVVSSNTTFSRRQIRIVRILIAYNGLILVLI